MAAAAPSLTSSAVTATRLNPEEEQEAATIQEALVATAGFFSFT